MHEPFMREAIKMAEEAFGCGEVPIGCVIVEEGGAVVARGRNRTNETKNATRHAEFEALDAVLARGEEAAGREQMSRLRLYVTVEPCIMCAAALRRVGLSKVYFGCFNERFGGCGSIVPAHCEYIAPQVDPVLEIAMLGAFRRECVHLLRRFYLRENERAPVPRKKGKRVFKEVEDGAP